MPLPMVDQHLAAAAIQRAARARMDAERKRTRSAVASLLAQKRRERMGTSAKVAVPFAPAAVAPPPVLPSLTAPLEERRRELQRLVEAERSRVMALQAACEGPSDETLPAPASPHHPPPRPQRNRWAR